MVKVKALIGDVGVEKSWEEVLSVESLETAEVEVREMVREFNLSLWTFEKPREFRAILGVVEQLHDE